MRDATRPITAASQLPRESLKSQLKHALLSAAACAASRASIEQTLRAPRVHLLCIHDGFDDEQDDLVRLCNFLAEQHELVPYSRAVETIRTGAAQRPTLAMSFDDGFKHHLRVARQLDDLGIRAIFFLCTEALNARNDDEQRRFCVGRLRRPWIELMNWNDAEQLLKH